MWIHPFKEIRRLEKLIRDLFVVRICLPRQFRKNIFSFCKWIILLALFVRFIQEARYDDGDYGERV